MFSAPYSYLLVFLAIMNFAGFLLMGYDKYRAGRNQWRVRERSLWLVSLAGGVLGTILGMHLFRHKNRKPAFRIGLPVLGVLYGLVLLYVCLR